MKIAVIGTGYVGLVTGTCFADSGNDVTCIDINQQKIEALNRGEIPIYEPGLAELVEHNVSAGRLHFTTDTPGGVADAEVVYLAVGTPQGDDGSADLSAMWAVVKAIAPHLRHDAVVVTKSTVPVGTNARIFAMLKEFTGRECDVASNPEFLKEGAAIEDFMKPDRVVVGVRRQEVADILHRLYKPFLRTEKPFLVMSPESAEMSPTRCWPPKLALSTKWPICANAWGATSTTCGGALGTTAALGSPFCFPAWATAAVVFPKMYARSCP
jgi:UDPglucose 6-dehydrogenase